MRSVSMFIEMESFNELKQASGYGVPLQNSLREERWVSTEAGDVSPRANVETKKIGERRSRRLRTMEDAIDERAGD